MTKFKNSFLSYLNSISSGRYLVFYVKGKDSFGASANDEYLRFAGMFTSGTHINPDYSQQFKVNDWQEHLRETENVKKLFDALNYQSGIEAYIYKNQIIKFDQRAFETGKDEEVIYSF